MIAGCTSEAWRSALFGKQKSHGSKSSNQACIDPMLRKNAKCKKARSKARGVLLVGMKYRGGVLALCIWTYYMHILKNVKKLRKINYACTSKILCSPTSFFFWKIGTILLGMCKKKKKCHVNICI
jgi:hypothetical protein